MFNRQKQLRIWDQQRHREKLADVKADYTRKYENKLNDFKRHSDEKLAAQLQEFKEKEAAYRRHIAELEADLARYKGRGEKAPKARQTNIIILCEAKCILSVTRRGDSVLVINFDLQFRVAKSQFLHSSRQKKAPGEKSLQVLSK